jgi:hypothetical protein
MADAAAALKEAAVAGGAAPSVLRGLVRGLVLSETEAH